MMKKTLYILAVLASVIASCSKNTNIYEADEYVMFADTLKIYPVQEDVEYFSIPVVSTVKRNYDRTFGVEIIDAESDAIEKLQYSLKSNTVTIKAGEVRADVLVHGIYDNLDPAKTPQITLSLVMPEELEMPAYGRSTKVLLQKCCPFDVNNFTGWCVLSSTFLQSYNPYGSYQRLIKTKPHPTKEDCIICENWMNDGYDIVLRFDTSDPLNPVVSMDGEQSISDEGSFFGMAHGDDRIRAINSYLYDSYYYNCGSYLYIWTAMYVNDLNTSIGTVGHFYNIMEWVSDEEARRLQEENGM